MIKKTYFFVALLLISGFAATTVAFGQSTSPSSTATPTPTPAASAAVIPSSAPSTGMGGK